MNNEVNKTKEEVLEDLKKRLDDQIIEKTNYDLLVKMINKADSASEIISIAELGTSFRRTGFFFDKRLEKSTDTITYLKKNEELSFESNIKKGNMFSEDIAPITHKLIIGDNYPALLNLLIEYRGKINVIYIDPPYGVDSMGNFAATNYDNAITRDNLLSMLYPRLVVARELLSSEGVIFCSIDDRNQAYVKGLFDEVFGERNFLANISVVNNLRGRSDDKFFATANEYLLCYAKDCKNVEIGGFDMSEEFKNEYNKNDEISNYKEVSLQKTGKNSRRIDRPNMYYPIYYSEKTKKFSLEQFNDSIEIFPSQINGEEGCWRWGKNKFLENKDTELCARNVNGIWRIYVKMRDVVDGVERTIKPKTLWQETSYDTGNGGRMLNSILNSKFLFQSPKPVQFIKDIIKISTTNPAAIILDFFAGSGTTGQAVLELNKEDGGKRQFILCTNNEITEQNPNGIAIDVTTKRLKRVMTGSCYDGSADFDWIKKNEPLGDNLLVCELDTVADFEKTEGKTPFDVIDETLYGKEKCKTIKEKIAWVCDNLEIATRKLEESPNS